MDQFNWESLLRELGNKLIDADEWIPNFGGRPTQEMLVRGWLGTPGASEEQIFKAESRLQVQLPPSYREFLKISNGWGMTSSELILWSTEQIEWFYVRNQRWIDAWHQNLSDERPSIPDDKYFIYDDFIQQDGTARLEYLQSALEISRDSDGDIYLLVPDIVSDGGEWEAWIFSNRIAGAYRYKSFYHLMQDAAVRGIFV
jgi:SMI1 / KNR4 family (SUKH-1)